MLLWCLANNCGGVIDRLWKWLMSVSVYKGCSAIACFEWEDSLFKRHMCSCTTLCMAEWFGVARETVVYCCHMNQSCYTIEIARRKSRGQRLTTPN